MRTGEVRTEHLATHTLPLDQGPRGYELFRDKEDGCVRASSSPTAAERPAPPGTGSGFERAGTVRYGEAEHVVLILT